MKPTVHRSALRLAVTVIAAIALLAVPARGAAVDDPLDLVPPTLLTPPDGGQVVAGTPVAFRIQTHPDETHTLTLQVSRSPAVDAEGVIGTDAEIDFFSPVPGQPGVYESAPTYHDYSGFWMNTPGVYYWQAYRIHCAVSSSDCRLESAIRTLVITPRPVTAQILGIGPTRACYRTRDHVHVTATGFAPGASVELQLNGRFARSATADQFGDLDTTVTIPSAGYGPAQRRYRLTVAERNFPANTASTSILAANLAFTATPSYFVRRGQRVLFRFSGMVANRTVYAHYRLGGRTLANVPLGVARGACGMLTVRAPLIPARVSRRGAWLVQFDALRGYSPSANPRLRATVTVRTVVG